MNILITGAAGFIGSHLAESCLQDGHRVVGIDNFCTGSPANLKAVVDNARFSFLEADVSAPGNMIEQYLANNGFAPNLIYHFASPASPVDYAALALETLEVNSIGTRNCIEIGLKHNARLLFASTSECYGDPKEHPQRESYWGNVNPVGPRSCYDESKRFGEALMFAYMRHKNLDLRVVRIFNTYGPRMRPRDGRVVPNFIMQALAQEPLTVYGGGLQTRSFCYVDDLVEGIRLCADSEKTAGIVVNLGNPEEHTIREFAEIVCEIAGVPFRVVAKEMPVDDPGRRCPNIDRAHELLGWSPRVSLRDGLKRALRYFQEQTSTVKNSQVVK